MTIGYLFPRGEKINPGWLVYGRERVRLMGKDIVVVPAQSDCWVESFSRLVSLGLGLRKKTPAFSKELQ